MQLSQSPIKNQNYPFYKNIIPLNNLLDLGDDTLCVSKGTLEKGGGGRNFT